MDITYILISMQNDPTGAAVIGDVVGSRWKVRERDWHGELVAALDRVNAQVPAVQPLAPTVGDEFQGLYATPGAALRATLLVRLELGLDDDLEIDCRFGVGYGYYAEIGAGALPVQAGTAWWSARDAIVTAKEQESVRQPTLRTWYSCEAGPLDAAPLDAAPLDAGPTNAYLLARDHLVSQLDARSRRLLLGIIQGRTQVELARREGIGQSAVSRNLRRNGAYALMEGADLIDSRGTS